MTWLNLSAIATLLSRSLLPNAGFISGLFKVFFVWPIALTLIVIGTILCLTVFLAPIGVAMIAVGHKML